MTEDRGQMTDCACLAHTGRAKTSARTGCRYFMGANRAGFEPRHACGLAYRYPK
jgi:hypothetical protein